MRQYDPYEDEKMRPWRDVKAEVEARYENSLQESREQSDPCDHPPHKLEFRKKLNAAGAPMLRKQCLACGKVLSQSYRQLEVKNFKTVPMVDGDLARAYEENVTAHWENHRNIYESKQRAVSEAWQSYHDQYMRTRQWAMLRAQALDRDGNKCQGCLTRNARHVHHLTYEHFGDELLFELISLCEGCHQKIHPHRELASSIPVRQ